MSDNLQDSSHFYRIISLVVDLGTETLLETFYQKIPRADVQASFIRCHSTFNLLKRRKILNPAQFDLVTASNLDPNLFDISLLITLLRNICPDVESPLCTWENPPPNSSDTTLGAELLRLKDIRNRVTAHGTKAQMGREDFKEFWKDIKRILLSIAGKISPSYADEVKKKISVLKLRHLEPQGDREKRMLALFKKWQEDEKEGLKVQLKEDLTTIQDSLQSLHLKVDANDTTDAARRDANNPEIHLIQEQVLRIENGMRTIATQESVEEVSAHIKNGGDVQGKIMKQMESFQKEIQEIKKILRDFFARQHGGQGSMLQTDSACGYPQQQGLWNGYQPIGAQHDQSLGNPYNGIPPMSGQFTNIQPMSGQYSGYTGIQPMSAQFSAIQPMSSRHVQPISPRQTNEMTEKELRTLSGEIGLEWEEVGTFLDFKRKQIEQLKLMYPHQKWHDVAASSGEDPRLLLAGVFIELKNRQLASKIVSRDLLNDASRYRVNPSTVAAIQSINFDIVPPPQYLHQIIVNHQVGANQQIAANHQMTASPQMAANQLMSAHHQMSTNHQVAANQQMGANQQMTANQQTTANQQVFFTANHGVLNMDGAGAINVFSRELNITGSICMDGSGNTVPIQQSFSSSGEVMDSTDSAAQT